MSKNMIFAFASILVLTTGCGADKKIEALGQIDVPTSSSNPGVPTAAPKSIAIVSGSNALPISSFDQNVQTFYYDFSGLTATNLDFLVESVVSSCPSDPTSSFTIVDYTSGSESVIRDLGRSATIEKPAATARLKVVISGLSGCMGYGLAFHFNQI